MKYKREIQLTAVIGVILGFLFFIGVKCFSKPLIVFGIVGVNDGKAHLMPEYFSTLCRGRIEVRRGTLCDTLVPHSLDLNRNVICLEFLIFLFRIYRSDIESCSFERLSSFVSEELQ